MRRGYALIAAALTAAQYGEVKRVEAVITSGADEILAELSITDDTTSNAGCPINLPYGTATNADGTTPTIDQFMVEDTTCSKSGVEDTCSYAVEVCCCKDCITTHVDAQCVDGEWQLAVEGNFPPECSVYEPMWFQACLACDATINEGSSAFGVAGLTPLGTSKRNDYTECCQACNANANCALWTFESATGTCMIFMNTEEIDNQDSLAPALGMITGVMKSDVLVPAYPEPVNCFQTNTCDVVLQAFPIICSASDGLLCRVSVLIESITAVSAFDFQLTTSAGFALPVKGANGGLAAEHDFTVLGSENKGTVIGYSDGNAAVLPMANDGQVLTEIELDINVFNAEFFADNTVVCISSATTSNNFNILSTGHPDCSVTSTFDTAVTISLGDVKENGNVGIYIASTQHLTGFQFDVVEYIDEETDPVPVSLVAASGGLSESNGFLVTVTAKGAVIGWYLGAGEGLPPSGTLVTPELLTTLHFESQIENVCLHDVYFNEGALTLTVEEPPCPPVSGILSAQECNYLTSEAFNEGFEAGVESGKGDQETYNQGFSDGQLVAEQSYQQGLEACEDSTISADFNTDGKIDILDITLMIQYIVYQNGR